MLIWILTVVLLCLLAIAYSLEEQSLIAPSVLFSGGMAMSSLCAALMAGMWGVELHFGAFSIVVIGVSLFIATSALAGRFLRRHVKRDDIHMVAGNGFITTSWHFSIPAILVVGLIAVITTSLTFIRITEFFPTETLNGAIKALDTNNKRTAQLLSFGVPLNQLRSFCTAAGYFMACIVGINLACGPLKSGRFAASLFTFALLFLFSLATGSRTVGIGYVFCILIAFVVYKLGSSSRDNHRKHKLRIVFVAIGVGIVIVFSFQFLALGRSVSGSMVNYIGLYLGAEIYNLDHFMQFAPTHQVTIPGGMTFYTTLSYIGDKTGIPELSYVLDHPFLRSPTGYGMGNVYTTFYAFYYDFGLLGVLVLVPIMALVSTLFYHKATRPGEERFRDVWVAIYGYVAYQLILCFFSNKVFENVISISFVRFVVYLVAARCLLSLLTPEHVKNVVCALKAKLQDLFGK